MLLERDATTVAAEHPFSYDFRTISNDKTWDIKITLGYSKLSLFNIFSALEPTKRQCRNSQASKRRSVAGDVCLKTRDW